MSFPRYPEYKNPGVEWLDGIPASWKVEPFFAYFRERNQSNLGMKESNLLSLSYGRVVRKDINTLDGLLPASFETYQIVDPDDLVFRLTDLQNDKRSLRSAIVEERGIITSAYLAVRPVGVVARFAHYQFRGYDLLKVFYSMGGGLRQGMKYSDLRRLPSLIPPKEDQIAIAAFLDHETAKIDALIAEQQRLIELLKEKRQAVISYAVTNGLNPGAPMKDSSVEWLGEVPAHWRVKSLRYLGECQNGINIAGDAFGSGSPFVSYSDVYNNEVLPTTVKGLVQSSESEQRRYSVQAGDVFFTRTSETVDEIGFSALCVETISNAVFAGFLIRFRPKSDVFDEGFARYYFRSQRLREFFNKEMNLVTRASLSQDLLKLLPVTVPPQDEQAEIAKFLDKVTNKFTALIAQCEGTVRLLAERRSALISAAVTGKIDVRNWKSNQSANASVEKEVSYA